MTSEMIDVAVFRWLALSVVLTSFSEDLLKMKETLYVLLVRFFKLSLPRGLGLLGGQEEGRSYT